MLPLFDRGYTYEIQPLIATVPAPLIRKSIRKKKRISRRDRLNAQRFSGFQRREICA
jgi:hypothetical protein